MTIAFISGHLTLTAEEFAEHYVPEIDRALVAGYSFVIGDARGTDDMAQRYITTPGSRPCRASRPTKSETRR